MVNFLTNALFTIIQIVLRVLKKAVCCLKRRRKSSLDPVPLTNIGIVPNVDKELDSQTWNSWEDPFTVVTTGKPVDPVQQQIELYRQQRIASSNESGDKKVDYFQDMTPQITKQTKVLIHSRLEDQSNSAQSSSNISFAFDPVFNSSELGLWEDSQSWEDQTQEDGDANNMIREKKRLDREKRLAEQQKKKLERELQGGKSLLATRSWKQPQILWLERKEKSMHLLLMLPRK